MRYGLEQVKMGINDPHLFLREINRVSHRRFNRWEYNKKGVDIFNQDWDNLIILDACRADAYQTYVLPKLPEGNFKVKKSRGGSTREWTNANFMDRKLHDVVYVSGSSWIFKLGDEINTEPHAVVDAKDDLDYNQENQVKKALKAENKYPKKRLLIHLIPPHHPYMGPTADKKFDDLENQDSRLFEKLRKGELKLDKEVLWDMYIENIDRVIKPIKKLLNNLSGKTVISADHGELLGDRVSPIPIKEWGHMSGLYIEELVDIPWHVHNGNRKTISEDPPVEDKIDPRTEEEIDQHLKSLGYKV